MVIMGFSENQLSESPTAPDPLPSHEDELTPL